MTMKMQRRGFIKKAVLALAGVGILLRTSSATATQDGIRNHCSVKDFGAIGDGLADDTVAIQAAIDACDNVLIPVGRYKCSAPLRLVKSDFKLRGDGELQFQRDLNGGALIIAAHVSDIEIEGLTIRLLNNIDGFAFCGIFSMPDIASVSSSRFLNLKIIGAAFGINVGGVKPTGGGLPDSSNVSFARTESRQIPRLESQMNGRNSFIGNVIRNSLFLKRIGTGGAHGIYVRNSGFNIISNNHIENMQGGILAASYGMISNNVILNCYEDNGIYCASSKGLTVQANYIENTKSDGIAFNHSVNCVAVGNQIFGAGNASFRLQESCNIVISGNTCNSKGMSGSYVRSYIDGNAPNASDNIVIENNIFSGGVGKGNAFSFGTAPLGSPYRNWRIVGNIIQSVDLSALTSFFFGPYSVINFGLHAGNVNLHVESNIFSDIQVGILAPLEASMIVNATRNINNVFEYHKNEI